MIRIGIYDEDRISCQRTLEYIKNRKKYSDLNVLETDIPSLVFAIKEHTFDFHILVMEVISEKMDILQLVAQINQKFPDCQIIYLTNQADYVSRVYETEHCYFVWKRELEQVMPLALCKAFKRIEAGELQYLSIVCDRKHMDIPVSQILYIERFLHQCRVVTENEMYESYFSLKQFADKLPSYFVRCHTGYLVNGKCIERVSGKSLFLRRGGQERVELPVGRSYSDGVKAAYRRYSGGEKQVEF